MVRNESHLVRGYYINSMGDGSLKPYALRLLNELHLQGIDLEHIPVNWYSKESLESVINRVIKIIERSATKDNEILLIGASAGGSMALNAFVKLKKENVYLVTLCSRLNEVPLPLWDWRTLSKAAHLNSKAPSLLFKESVLNATTVTIPKLTSDQKKRIITVQNWADEVVPTKTMRVPGVKNIIIPAVGHRNGLKQGMRLIRSFYTSNFIQP